MFKERFKDLFDAVNEQNPKEREFILDDIEAKAKSFVEYQSAFDMAELHAQRISSELFYKHRVSSHAMDSATDALIDAHEAVVEDVRVLNELCGEYGVEPICEYDFDEEFAERPPYSILGDVEPRLFEAEVRELCQDFCEEYFQGGELQNLNQRQLTGEEAVMSTDIEEDLPSLKDSLAELENLEDGLTQ